MKVGRSTGLVAGSAPAGRWTTNGTTSSLSPARADGVDAALGGLRNLYLEGRLPTEIVGRVGVEVHGGVLAGAVRQS